MGAKRALIVDDSKSARVFLERILEKYEIEVDSAENAEAAIEYLASHRPDVIFMDHLMPGMDGFQAVQAIKNNPLTATIPILMYTSQEGELYLGQARALGAVGVLPKQIKPIDVSKVLYQLHLLADRRTEYQTSFRPVNLGGAAVDQGAANDSGVLPKVLTESALREQFAELRRALVAGVDTQTERITAEVRALLLEALPPVPMESSARVSPAPSSSAWGWIVASLALAVALATTALWWQQTNELRALTAQVAQLRLGIEQRSDTAGAQGPPAPVQQPDAQFGAAAATIDKPVAVTAAAAVGTLAEKPLPTDAKPLLVTVPYGSEALGGGRLELIRQLTDRLLNEKHSGVVDIKTYAGRFCLIGNSTDGFSLAPDETAFAKCDVIGNPSDDALSPAQRTPLSFANLVGGVRNTSRGALELQASQGDPAALVAAYPAVAPYLTAGEWNRAGSANNRIEIRVR